MKNLWPEIENILLNVRKPSRYAAQEVLPSPKEKDLKVCLVFPDTAEIGLSNTGLAILQKTLRDMDSVFADIAFAPWFDMEEQLRDKELPAFSYFNTIGLADFDIIGFSLPHELCYTNVLNILDLSGLPVDRKDRQDGPLVIAGGTGAFNPSVLEDFIDAFAVGDGEDVISEIAGACKNTSSKTEMIKRISKIEGVYISGKGTKVRKRVSKMGFKQTYSFAQPVHSHASVEIMRGCTAGCRFCQAGFINRPVREKDATAVLEEALSVLDKTGYKELSMLSLSTSDYTRLPELNGNLDGELGKRKVSLSLPSLRMDTFSLELAACASSVRKHTLTFAPEAGNKRLRAAINKNLSDEEIEKAITGAFKKGFSKIKLYFMIGFPGETDDDIDAIAGLAEKIRDLGRKHLKGTLPSITVSVSTFVPKPHTPLQWSKQITIEHTKEKQHFLKNRIRGLKGITFKWHDASQSALEGFIARGDKKTGMVIRSAWEKGARFDNWTEFFNWDIWKDASKQNSVDFYEYLNERPAGEALAWDAVDSLVSKDFLLQERQNYIDGMAIPDCRTKCLDCGVCTGGLKNTFAKGLRVKKDTLKTDKQDCLFIYELNVEKSSRSRFFSHLEYIDILTRAFTRAALPMVYTSGFNPRPKLSFSQALSVGKESSNEKVTVRLYKQGIDIEKINEKLPDGIRITGQRLKHSQKIAGKAII